MKISWYGWAIGGAGIFVLVIVSSLFISPGDCRDFKEGKLLVNGQTWPVALADTDTEQIRGLGGCQSIPNGSGMYFPYDKPTETAFWMKGMVIPIDIIWIRDGVVVAIHAQVQPLGKLQDDPPRYQSPQPITAVLEVGAGEALKHGIQVGSQITAQ